MDARRAKQVIYGTLYLIIVFAIGFGVYWRYVYTPPSCFDSAQNQGETGVDCGGPCAKICVPANLPITTVGAVSVFSADANHVTLLAKVANGYPGFGAQSFDYTFALYAPGATATSTPIGSVSGRSFLYGSEVKYLLAPNVRIPGPIGSAALTIANPVWVPSADLGFVPQFSLQVVGSGPSTSSTISVAGELTNGDVSAFGNVLVIGVFYDDFGNALGASQTILDHIAPNQTEPFSIIYPATQGIDLSRTQLFAYALR